MKTIELTADLDIPTNVKLTLERQGLTTIAALTRASRAEIRSASMLDRWHGFAGVRGLDALERALAAEGLSLRGAQAHWLG